MDSDDSSGAVLTNVAYTSLLANNVAPVVPATMSTQAFAYAYPAQTTGNTNVVGTTYLNSPTTTCGSTPPISHPSFMPYKGALVTFPNVTVRLDLTVQGYGIPDVTVGVPWRATAGTRQTPIEVAREIAADVVFVTSEVLAEAERLRAEEEARLRANEETRLKAEEARQCAAAQRETAERAAGELEMQARSGGATATCPNRCTLPRRRRALPQPRLAPRHTCRAARGWLSTRPHCAACAD
jgi:hypothetical protein